MPFPILGTPKPAFFDSSGSPLVSGTLSILDPADDTNKASYPTYDDAVALTNAHTNPITLDSRGETTTEFWGLDGEDYKLVLKDSAGNTIWTVDPVNVPIALPYGITAAETAAGVTPTNYSYPPGNVLRYGALLDGSSDDSAAWASAESVATNGGPPIYVPYTSTGMAIASGVSSVNSVVFEEGAFLLYTGSGEEAALTLGVVTGNTASKVHRNIYVYRESLSDWTDEGNIGVRCLNLVNCYTELFRVERFTVGVQAEGNDYGNAYNKYVIGMSRDNKIAVQLLTADTSLTAGYCNENTFYGGRLTNITSTNTTLDRWGVKITSTRATKYYSNSNLFHKTSFELQDGGTGTAYPILIEYGNYNKFDFVRDESNDTPFMECKNDSEWNRASTTSSSASAVSNTGTYTSNFVEPERSYPYQKVQPQWQSPAVHLTCNEYDGAGDVYFPGMSIRASASGTQFLDADGFTITDDYLEILSTRSLGIMVDVGASDKKRWIFRRDTESANGGRLIIIPYDTSQTQLTTDGGYVSGTAANSISHTTDWGGAYKSGGDSASDYFFSLSDSVHFIWVGIAGGTAVARARSIGLQCIDGGAISAFQGFDGFPNDTQRYASAVPATATAGPYYRVGTRIVNTAAAAGGSPGWICTTQGLGGTAVFKAEAAVAA